jgi:hypothetical protein
MMHMDDVKIAGYTFGIILAWTVASLLTPAAATVLTMPVCIALILPCALHLHRRRRRAKRGRTRPA